MQLEQDGLKVEISTTNMNTLMLQVALQNHKELLEDMLYKALEKTPDFIEYCEKYEDTQERQLSFIIDEINSLGEI